MTWTRSNGQLTNWIPKKLQGFMMRKINGAMKNFHLTQFGIDCRTFPCTRFGSWKFQNLNPRLQLRPIQLIFSCLGLSKFTFYNNVVNNQWPSKSGDYCYLLDILDSLVDSWPSIQFLLSTSHLFVVKIFLTQHQNTGIGFITHAPLVKRKIQFSNIRWNSDYNNADAKLPGPGFIFVSTFL